MIKNMLKNILIFIAIIFMTSSYGDSLMNHPLNLHDPDFIQVQKTLSKPDSIEGSFSQVREMKILSQPLVSSGTFVLSKTKGLIWKQDRPFMSTMTVTSNRIEQKVMDNPPSVLTEKEEPTVFSFTKIFLSVFQGNLTDIQQYFSVYFTGDIQQWEMLLTPKGTPLNKAIYSIQLRGGNTVEHITVIDTEKNALKIHFSDITLHDE